ncbi:endolysin [Phage C48C1]|nr:endolysin [Phage C48C1]
MKLIRTFSVTALVSIFTYVGYVNASPQVSNEDLECLALNVYHEARSESLAGQYAVADVVLNRVESPIYPNNVCDVVYQGIMWEGFPVRDKCQFSWYCDGKSDHPTETDSWYRAIGVAVNILHNDQFRGITESATHYHTEYVNPTWNKSMNYIGRIGNHLFYLETR